MSCSNSSLLSTHCQATAGLLSPYINLQFLECYIDQSVQLLSRFRFFAIPWIAAFQASLSITNSQSSLKLTSIELVMPSSHFILWYPLLLLPPIPPSIRVFSNIAIIQVLITWFWSLHYGFVTIMRSQIKNMLELPILFQQHVYKPNITSTYKCKKWIKTQ